MSFDLDAARRFSDENGYRSEGVWKVLHEALTEIERLRRRLKKTEFALDKMTDLYEKMAEERRALRDAQEKR